MVKSATALFVRNSSVARRAARLLAADGWHIAHCAGPHKRECPLAQGEVCGVRRTSNVAIVEIAVSEDPEVDDPLDLLRCAVADESPGLLVFNRYGHVVGGRVHPRRVSLPDGDEIASIASTLASET